MDDQEFTDNLLQWTPWIDLIIYNYYKEEDDVDNTRQEIYLKAWKFRYIFTKDRGKFSTWISTVAHSVCLELKRKQKAKFRIPKRRLINVFSEYIRPDDFLYWKEDHKPEYYDFEQHFREVVPFIHTLKKIQKDILNGIYVENKQVQDLISTLNVSKQYIHEVKNKGLDTLRYRLKEADV